MLCGVTTSTFVCNTSFCMSAFIFTCRHADIKVYKLTNVIAIQSMKLYFMYSKPTLHYKPHFLQHSKNFVRNKQNQYTQHTL